MNDNKRKVVVRLQQGYKKDPRRTYKYELSDSNNNCMFCNTGTSEEKSVREIQYFSIIFDETKDISHISQMSISLRNIDKENKVHERYTGFINCHKYVYTDHNELDHIDQNCLVRY